jgi:hypothetical protein
VEKLVNDMLGHPATINFKDKVITTSLKLPSKETGAMFLYYNMKTVIAPDPHLCIRVSVYVYVQIWILLGCVLNRVQCVCV